MKFTKIAHPKVNLYLHVKGKRADGYHLLESLVCFPEGGDKLEVSACSEIKITVSGPYSNALGPSNDNLVLRAARLLQNELNIGQGAHIHLEKNLPVASGIGGGSADAAACLHLLCELWGISPSVDTLKSLGIQLGADVAVCLYGKPAIMKGAGEIVEPVGPLPDLYILLVNPLVGVSTSAVFKAIDWALISENEGHMGTFGTGEKILEFLGRCTNDLQAPAITLAPVIQTVLQAMESQGGCCLARMSGSGATCFGLFRSAKEASLAKDRIQEKEPRWWGAVSRLSDGSDR